MLLVAALVFAALPAAAEEKLEGEELRVIRCTSGETTVWKMVEDGFAEPGQFSGETSLYWHDAAEAGAVLELARPVKKLGHYALSVGLVRYRTFGTFQFLMDGKDVGDPVDMYGHPEVDAASPFTVTMGTFALEAGDRILALRLVGTNPNTVMPKPLKRGLISIDGRHRVIRALEYSFMGAHGLRLIFLQDMGTVNSEGDF